MKINKFLVFTFIFFFFGILTCYATNEPQTIVYIDGVNGNDETGNGETPDTAIKTLKKAYELLDNGGSIYIVNTITIDSDISLTNNSYKDNETTITLNEGKSIKEIKRYSQPTAYESLSGYTSASCSSVLIYNSEDINLSITNLIIDGHGSEIKDVNDKTNAPALTNSKQLIINYGNIRLNNAEIRDNTGEEYGSGIYNRGSATLTIGKSLLHDLSGIFGGAIYNDKNASVFLEESIIYDNEVTKSGGGVYLDGNTTIKNSKFYNNISTAGGGIYASGYTLIENSEFYKNHSGGSGGGIFVSSPNILILKNSKLYENSSLKYGAGLYTNGHIEIYDTEVYRNKASIDGGGITNNNKADQSIIMNTKFYENESPGCGGALELYYSVKLSGLEIYNNKGKDGGGIFASGTITMENTKVYDNISTNTGDGIYISKTFNLGEGNELINNDIYLTNNSKIDVISNITNDGQFIITPNEYTYGRTIVSIDSSLSQVASDIIKHFKLTPNANFVARPGDLIKDETYLDSDIIISEFTPLIINKNTTDEVSQLPESVQIFKSEKNDLSYIKPKRTGFDLDGWSKTANGEKLTEEELETFLSTMNSEQTLYVVWKKHVHSYDEFIATDNTINKVCSCGKIEASLSLNNFKDLIANGLEKPIVIKDEIGISEEEYELLYYQQNENGEWKELEEVPKEVGTYKAVLKLGNHVIQKEYEIIDKNLNPNTKDNIIPFIIFLTFSMYTYIISTIKSNKINNLLINK